MCAAQHSKRASVWTSFLSHVLCVQSFDRAMNHLDKAFGFVSSSHQYISRKVTLTCSSFVRLWCTADYRFAATALATKPAHTDADQRVLQLLSVMPINEASCYCARLQFCCAGLQLLTLKAMQHSASQAGISIAADARCLYPFTFQCIIHVPLVLHAWLVVVVNSELG